MPASKRAILPLVFTMAVTLVASSSLASGPRALPLVAGAAHGAVVYSVDWCPIASYLAIGSDYSTGGFEVRMLSFDGATLGTLPSANFSPGHDVNSVSWRPDGSFLAIAGDAGPWDPEISIFTFDEDLQALSINDVASHGASVNTVAWTQDGMNLATGGETAAGLEVKVWDTGTIPVELSFFMID